jgi:hypothetical protein
MDDHNASFIIIGDFKTLADHDESIESLPESFG